MDLSNIRNFQQAGKTDGVTYGYIRVSTITQHDDRQRIAMEEFGITADHIFIDKQSGKDFDRPAYNKMMAQLTRGDTVVVNIILSYLIQSHLWMQSSQALDIWAFGDFVIFAHKAS